MKSASKKSENEKRIESVRIDLAAAQAKLQTLDSAEHEALSDSAAHSAWRGQRDAAVLEVDRLERWIVAIETTASEQQRIDADEALRRRIDAANARNVELAERVRSEGAQLARALKLLVRDVAAATVEANELNRLNQLRDEPMAYVPSIDFMARGRPALPREDLETKVVELWTFASTGGVIGDASMVTVSTDDPTRGTVPAGFAGVLQAAVKRQFRAVAHRPYVPAELAGYLHSYLRLPGFFPGDPGFDGSNLVIEQVAMLDPDAPPPSRKKLERPTQTELILIEDDADRIVERA